MKRKLETNEDFVRDLMAFSEHGALMQIFVMTAIEKYAQQALEAGAERFDSAMLNGKAWVGTAAEALKRLESFYNREQ